MKALERSLNVAPMRQQGRPSLAAGNSRDSIEQGLRKKPQADKGGGEDFRRYAPLDLRPRRVI